MVLMPVERTDEIAGYVTLGRAAELLSVSAPRVHQMLKDNELDGLGLSTAKDAKKAMVVLVSLESIQRYLDAHPNRKRRGPEPGQGGRHPQPKDPQQSED